MTTLKIYQADEMKAVEMDEEAQNFRKITMKVLTMQLNSTSVMDIIAYGGAAVGMITAIHQYIAGNYHDWRSIDHFIVGFRIFYFR